MRIAARTSGSGWKMRLVRAGTDTGLSKVESVADSVTDSLWLVSLCVCPVSVSLSFNIRVTTTRRL